MSTQAYKVNIKKAIYFYKYILDNYLHLWPASDPLIFSCCIGFSSGGPDEGGVASSVLICAAIVPIGVAPGVDEVVGFSLFGLNHGGFGFEVAF